MIHYILQILTFQLMFLLIYDVFLKRETFFNINRIYLLITSVLSFILPFIKLESVRSVVSDDFVIVLPEVVIGNVQNVSLVNTELSHYAGITIEQPSMPVWQIILFSGIALSSILFLYKLIKLYLLKSNNPHRWNGNVLIVELLKSTSAFSFFNTIFLGEHISETEKPTIFKHELVHVKQYHTLDLLWFELLRIVLWFNPMVYMYQNRIKALHEFIADQHAVKQSGKKEYYEQLLNQAFDTQNLSFTNTFFKTSLIKKRIFMLQKSKSQQAALIKYALLIPVVFGMLIYTSAEVKAQEPEKSDTITEVLEIQEITEEQLIEKYYKEMKIKAKEGNLSEALKVSQIDLYQFRMSLDEYARLQAFIKFALHDRLKEKIDSGSASNSEIEILKKMVKTDKSFEDYIKRTKTYEYGRQWEKRTEGSTLKLFVKDLDNRSDEEDKRLQEKVDLIIRDTYWNALLISDGNKSTRMEFEDAEINAVTVEEVNEKIEVPFAVIENPPSFKECDGLTSIEEKKHCTSKYVAQFINKNFNTDLAVTLGLEGRQRIFVQFKIDKQGQVTQVAARGPHPKLEEEAVRVVSALPQFTPGTQKGKPVVVPYSLPILFQVQGTTKNEDSKTPVYDKFKDVLNKNSELINDGDIPFSEVDKAPIHLGCKDLENAEEQKKCTSQKTAMFVSKNFNTKLAADLGIEGRQRIFVKLTIDKTGNVINVGARAPHPKLEKEAVRAVSLLPQYIPGEHKGKNVDVSYSLPILFQLASGATKKD